ncbi:MAG: toprim domain-containing protein [Halobacteria archaeon]
MKTENRRGQFEFQQEIKALFCEMAAEVDAVVVEGHRDREALRTLGYDGPVLLASGNGCNRADFVESIAERHRTVALLTDFDREGRALAARLRGRLERSGVKVAAEWRNRLRDLLDGTGCRAVEGLKGLAEE